MKRFMLKRKITLLSSLALLAALSFSRPVYGSTMRDASNLEFPPGPQLLYPATEDIKLSGREFLEFKWNFPGQIDTDYFYLRIYKGRETHVKNMIFRQRYSVSELPPRMPASFFQLNQVYTWVLVQVYKDGRRSEEVYSPFKIIKP